MNRIDISADGKAHWYICLHFQACVGPRPCVCVGGEGCEKDYETGFSTSKSVGLGGISECLRCHRNGARCLLIIVVW